MLTLNTDVFARTAFRALRDPTQKDAVTDSLLENEGSAGSQTLFPFLWLIGSTQEALEHMGRVLDSGRGLRATLASIDIWAAFNRDRLGDPGLPAFFESLGMADYWRKHGNPDLCRVTSDKIECSEP